MAARLEHVRQLRGIATLKEFHDRITAEPGGISVSYAATRNYFYDRDAPAAYLARVAEVCNVRLEWLAAEKGKPTHEEQELADRVSRDSHVASDPVDEALRKALPFYKDLDSLTRKSVWQMFFALPSHNNGPERWSVEEGADRTGRLVTGPLETIGVELNSLADWQVRGYLALFAQAVELLTPIERLSAGRRFGADVPTFHFGAGDGADEKP